MSRLICLRVSWHHACTDVAFQVAVCGLPREVQNPAFSENNKSSVWYQHLILVYFEFTLGDGFQASSPFISIVKTPFFCPKLCDSGSLLLVNGIHSPYALPQNHIALCHLHFSFLHQEGKQNQNLRFVHCGRGSGSLPRNRTYRCQCVRRYRHLRTTSLHSASPRERNSYVHWGLCWHPLIEPTVDPW